MGEVYLAEDATLQRKVALKLLPERFSEDEERVRRFQREARAASALNHPNICTVYSIEQHDGQHFIVMELLEGRTLAEIIGHQPSALMPMLETAIQIETVPHQQCAVGTKIDERRTNRIVCGSYQACRRRLRAVINARRRAVINEGVK